MECNKSKRNCNKRNVNKSSQSTDNKNDKQIITRRTSKIQSIKSKAEETKKENTNSSNNRNNKSISKTFDNKGNDKSKSFQIVKKVANLKDKGYKYKSNKKGTEEVISSSSVIRSNSKKISNESIPKLNDTSEKDFSFKDIEKRIFEDLPQKTNKSNQRIKLKKKLEKTLNEEVSHNSLSRNTKDKKIPNCKNILVKNRKSSIKSKKSNSSRSQEVESSTDESDWEDVDELNEILKSREKESSNVQIELQTENLLWGITKRKRRSEKERIEDYLRKEINKSIREVHENMHKTHLLCLLAHGLYVNRLLCSERLTSCALLVISKQYYSPKRIDINHLERYVNWFCSTIKLKKNTGQTSLDTGENHTPENYEDILVKRFETKLPTCVKEMVHMFVIISRAIGMTVRYIQSLCPISWKPPSANLIKPKKAVNIETNENIINTNKLNNPKRPTNVKSRKMLSSDSEEELEKNSKFKKKIKTDILMKNNYKKEQSDSDTDFDISLQFGKKRKNLGSQKKNMKTKVKNVTESVHDLNSKKKLINDWAEIYVEEEEKWISIDVTRNQIHCASEIEGRTVNLAYVLAFSANNTVKDVTKKYMSSWLSFKDKVRLDNEWWSDSLKPFMEISNRRDLEEEKEIEENLKRQPLPKTINEYKNHPLYALQRHLLKFEALYPPDASPVGFLKGEPIYPRECVKIVGGREKWIKEAKVVRVNEEPYKIVKARPKWDRNTCQILKNRPLELFGEWQIEDYEPPIARNGRVPRNEYGNVDLFKPCMLPKGCVHIPINGLNRIARKIDIDCAPAVTGFDYHSGYCHPVYDGFVVCEEFKDILIDAWNQDQSEQAKKEEEKRYKRIYDNWKRLINGITLKDRLKERYGIASQDANKQLNEKSTKKKESNKKIKQEDLDALPSSTITHSVSNVRVDFESSVTDVIKRKRVSKRKLQSDKGKSSKLDINTSENISLHSSENDDLSETEKRKKIRSILDWNPSNNGNQSDPVLSDDSDCEFGISRDHLKNSSMLLTPVSQSNITNKPLKPKAIKNFKKSSSDDLILSSSDDDELSSVSLIKKRTLRSRKAKRNYKEEGESSSDISVGDSDTEDANYHPVSD